MNNPDNPDEKHKPVMLFGRDVSRIPCFRNTFLYGIIGGISVGLATFMFTSRPQLASHSAVGSFVTIGMCYWMHCRYKYAETKFELSKLKVALQQKAMYEGTQLEKEIERDVREC